MLRKTAILTLLVGLALAGTLQAAGSKKSYEADEAHTLYNQGVDLMKEADYASAAAKFEAALEKKETFPEAHNNLGYSLRKQGEDHYAAALEHYNRAIELAPKLAEAYHYRGILYALSGQEKEAQADLETLTDLDRDRADSLMAVIASGEEPEGEAGLAGRWEQ